METKILYYYAKFRKLDNISKRHLLNTLVKEKLGINCEVRMYRVLTRLTFQTLRKKYEEKFDWTKDEKKLSKVLKEFELAPQTCHHWYYSTFEKIKSLQPLKAECSSCSFNELCEYTVPDEIMEKINNKYDYLLVTKRLQKILVKIELFKDKLKGNWTDEETRICLRRLVEKDYFKDNISLPKNSNLIVNALKKRNIKSITALKWFYVLKNSPKLLKKAQQNEIMPDEVFDKGMIDLKEDIRGDTHANLDVCK